MGRSKGSRLNGWIESPNALRWRFGLRWRLRQLLRYAFTQTESSKIIIGNLSPRLCQCDQWRRSSFQTTGVSLVWNRPVFG
jgi:hypothetical protein